jgi:hypothetical protein
MSYEFGVSIQSYTFRQPIPDSRYLICRNCDIRASLTIQRSFTSSKFQSSQYRDRGSPDKKRSMLTGSQDSGFQETYTRPLDP